MRKALMLVLLVAIGGSFSGCSATRSWVQETLSESVDTLKKESKGALDVMVANLMSSLKDQGAKLMERLPSIAKGAAQSLLDAAEKKRKEALARELAKVDVELAKVVPDLSFDSNRDGAVTAADFLDATGELSPAASMRLVMYYQKQPAKEGQKKGDPNNLLYAVAGIGLLYAAGKAGQVVGKKQGAEASKVDAAGKTS